MIPYLFYSIVFVPPLVHASCIPQQLGINNPSAVIRIFFSLQLLCIFYTTDHNNLSYCHMFFLFLVFFCSAGFLFFGFNDSAIACVCSPFLFLAWMYLFALTICCKKSSVFSLENALHPNFLLVLQLLQPGCSLCPNII